MSRSAIRALRRRLVEAGGRAVLTPAEALGRRHDPPELRPARLIEAPLAHISPGSPAPFDEPVGFLDGVQRTELLGYVGTTPVLAARVAAGVRRRTERRSVGSVVLERQLVVARASVLALLGELPPGSEGLPLADHEPAHPVADHDRARAAVDAARTALEIAAARAFRDRHPGHWLLVDGTLTISPDWSTDHRMVAVVKSHGTLPFEGRDLEHYLALPAGHRSSVFAPATRQVTPVHACALRLWPWHGRDLLYGLVRVEFAAGDDPTPLASRLARHLLAERAPLANDARQDRLLYGVHEVERWLRARSA